jgi:hypothetical protein
MHQFGQRTAADIITGTPAKLNVLANHLPDFIERRLDEHLAIALWRAERPVFELSDGGWLVGFAHRSADTRSSVALVV